MARTISHISEETHALLSAHKRPSETWDQYFVRVTCIIDVLEQAALDGGSEVFLDMLMDVGDDAHYVETTLREAVMPQEVQPYSQR